MSKRRRLRHTAAVQFQGGSRSAGLTTPLSTGPVLLLALVLGAIVRAVPVLSTDFPLNDGGLFSVMSADLRENGLRLPAMTSYNAAEIPFAYPPLGLYLNAVLGPLFPGTETSLRFLPLLLAWLSVPAFYFMVRVWLTGQAAAVATLAWAVLPAAWMWEITGGGVTRALGMVLGFLAIGSAVRLLQSGDRRWWVFASAFSGLTLLSHPESAAFVATSLLVVLVAQHRRWRSLGVLVVVAGIAVLIAAPWWASVLVTHGPEPLTAAGQSRLMSIPLALAILFNLQFTGEAYFAVGAVLGVVGLAVAVVTGQWWIIGWLVAIFLVLPGGAETYGLVPWSLLIAIAVAHLAALASARRMQALGIGALGLALLASLWASHENLGLLTSLTPDQRDAMAWARENTPQDATFLVVTGSDWPTDATVEWFPALAQRRSVNTVQGLEFTTGDRWRTAVLASDASERCETSGAACLFEWSATFAAFNYVFMPRGKAPGMTADNCCATLLDSVTSDGRFALRGELAGAWVFERLPDSPAGAVEPRASCHGPIGSWQSRGVAPDDGTPLMASCESGRSTTVMRAP